MQRESGIRLTCFTDQPGVQLYVPAQSPARMVKTALLYPAYGSACLETQHFFRMQPATRISLLLF